MRERRNNAYRLIAAVFVAGTLTAGSGCAALLIGGAVAGGAAAGYAYYQGNHPHDHPYPTDVTLNATNGALADLEMPIVSRKVTGRSVELESRTTKGDKVNILVEPGANAALPSTRVHVRVGLFGDEVASNQIHAQIASRLQNNIPVPAATTNTPAIQPNNAIPPIQVQPAGMNQTAAPPVAGQEEAVPASSNQSATPTAPIPFQAAPKQ